MTRPRRSLLIPLLAALATAAVPARPTPGSERAFRPALQERRPRELGVTFRVEDPAMRVHSVRPGTMAAAADVRPGDVLVAVNGQAIDHDDHHALLDALGRAGSFRLALRRGDERLELAVGQGFPLPAVEPARPRLAPRRPPADGPDAFLNALVGTFPLEARTRSGPDAAVRTGSGRAKLWRSHGGRHLRGSFVYRIGGSRVEATELVTWNPEAERVELCALDSERPGLRLWVGATAGDGPLLALHPAAGDAHAEGERYELGLDPDGLPMRREWALDAAGRRFLRLELRCLPPGREPEIGDSADER